MIGLILTLCSCGKNSDSNSSSDASGLLESIKGSVSYIVDFIVPGAYAQKAMSKTASKVGAKAADAKQAVTSNSSTIASGAAIASYLESNKSKFKKANIVKVFKYLKADFDDSQSAAQLGVVMARTYSRYQSEFDLLLSETKESGAPASTVEKSEEISKLLAANYVEAVPVKEGISEETSLETYGIKK